MEIFSQMKNLRTLKLLDVYEPAQDDSKSLVNLEMAMMVIRTRFSMETEVKISVGGSALKEPNGTKYQRITTAGNFIPQNIKRSKCVNKLILLIPIFKMTFFRGFGIR